MPIEIQLPRLGWSMEEGTFIEWLKNDGDQIQTGDPIFSLESDKAAQEVESSDSGILHIPANGPKRGDVIKVGRRLAYLLAQGERAPDPIDHTARTPVPQTIPQSPPTAHPSTELSTCDRPTNPRTSPPASPRARRAAKQHSIDLSQLAPTGAGGRIRERDVLAAAQNALTREGTTSLPITPRRRAIADRLLLSQNTTVPVTITGRCDATALLAFRQQLRSASDSGSPTPIPSLNDLFIKLTASALREHPLLTATWAGDHLSIPDSIHIGIAVDTAAGLIVPVIRDVATSTLTQIATQTRHLIPAAQADRLEPSNLRGACFTISNLGPFGVDAFTPVINPPESAILGIGTIAREAVPQDHGGFIARDRLTMSLTFDHRVIDGADAARFLQTLRKLIEHPLPSFL